MDPPAATGCLLKVETAEPGSTLLFRLKSRADERAQPSLKLAQGSSLGHQFYILPNSWERQANLTGTVEYADAPECSWPVAVEDPAATTTLLTQYHVDGSPGFAREYKTQVPVGNGKVVEFYTYYGPGVGQSPPPPSPPTPCPWKPITAYCIPMRDDQGTGCLLKVESAEPGARMWFNLVSTEGEPLQTSLYQETGATTAHKLVYLQDSKNIQANFTGTVGYSKQSNCEWPVSAYDPSATYTFMGMYFPVWHWQSRWEKFQVDVPLSGDRVETVYTFCWNRARVGDRCH